MHLDKQLAMVLQQYGPWIYALLFAIVFAETGFVVTPFLPGDSLLFLAGALAATGGLNLIALCVLLIAAAILGNTVNFWIGRYLGPRVFQWESSVIFNRKALDRAHGFYEKHGGKAIVISRFVPIVRTFAPFVAGIAAMPHQRFQFFNVSGALLWVLSLTVAGYLFGNMPIIKNNLSAVMLAIIVISVLPVLIEFARARFATER